MINSITKPPVIFFQRKPRPGFNFSIEGIFESLRNILKNEISASIKTSSFFNNGYSSKLLNIIEASFHQKKKSISHITGETHFLNLLMRKQNVLLTIHDCRFMERKTGIQKRMIQWLYLTAPAKKSKFITTVSKTTKADIIKYTGCNTEKIFVIPNAVHNVFKAAPKSFNNHCPVILQIGAAPNKNLARLISAIINIECKLVIIGNPQQSDFEKLEKYKIQVNIKSNLSKEALYNEYINCDMLAFVSTYEGFGMPIIEAQSVERAVLTSNVSSMPEVAGEGACLVNPFDVDDIRNGISKIINNASYREFIIEKGKENIKRFNENVIADQYFEMYKKFNLS